MIYNCDKNEKILWKIDSDCFKFIVKEIKSPPDVLVVF